MSIPSLVRLVAVLLLALILQVSVLDEVVVFGAHPDLMVLLAASAGIVGGPVRGATVGFGSGLAADLAVRLPYGLSALTFTLVGFGAAYLATAAAGRDLPGARIALVVALAVGGTLLYGIIGTVLGQPGMLSSSIGKTLVVVGLGALVLGPLSLAALRWVLAPSAGPAGLTVPHGGSASA